MNLRIVFTTLCLAIQLLVAPALPVAAQSSATPMPAAAREAFDKGMLAVEQREWQTAVRYFTRAQEVEPYSPEILFNLGLAESKMPGRELRAIGWLRAYLARAPNAPNGDAVRKEIAGIEIRVEATVDKLISQVKQLVPKEDPGSRNTHYVELATAIARTGDIGDAKQTALKCAGQFLCTNSALGQIAALQYHGGDTAGAEATVSDIGSGIRYGVSEAEYSSQSRAYGYIACLQAIRGDFPGAEATIGKERWDRFKGFDYLFVGLEMALAGRRDQALSAVRKALDVCSREKDCQKYDLWMLQDGAWKIQAHLGETEAARQTFAAFAAKANNPHARFSPSVDRQRLEDLATGKDLGLVGFRNRLAFIGDSRLLLVSAVQPASSEKHVAWVRFVKESLNDELYTNQQGAISTIAGKARPQDIVEGMLKAIESITGRLNDTRRLGR